MDTWWREQGDLDVDQREVIRLEPDGSYLVKGPPGSGKTNLLLLRANYLINTRHSNLAIVVFNRTLRDFIRAGSGRYDFDSRNVMTSHQFFLRLIGEVGGRYEEVGDFEEDRQGRLAATEAALSANPHPIFDVILLDEAQDYLEGEIRLFRRLCRDIFAVADSRQQIYSSASVIPVLESVVDETLPLRFHYRNGQPICVVADAIGSTFTAGYDPILPTCKYNSPYLASRVEIFQGDVASQGLEIAGRLTLQRRTYPEGLLGVICPRLSEVRDIAGILKAEGLEDAMCVQDREDGYQQIDPERPIWVSSIHSAKGLEFRALHIAGAEFVTSFREEQKRLAYTAITRAKTSLVVYFDRMLPPYFDSALNAVSAHEAGPHDLGVAFGHR